VSQPAGENPAGAPSPQQPESPYPQTFVGRLTARYRVGGIVTPIFTVIIAFLAGGIVVAATGHNPLETYRAIFNGTGLNWFFPWVTGSERADAATNLQQTLILTTPLILCGLAVAFAFRCGMFNIGGQGQYFMGIIVANWLGVSLAGLGTFPHIVLVLVASTLAGALWAGIAGFLKATVGAHEVITTIMLNWIAYYVAQWIFGDGGPLQNSTSPTTPISDDVASSAKLPVFWGQQQLQGLHIGFFIALAALVVFHLVLNRTTTGYEVRAVGFNPEAAAYGGISVKKNLIRAMAISGAFAGLAGALDMIGYLYHYGSLDVPVSAVGFLGIAVALLGRNTAVGVGFAALLFAALLFGTTHGLTSTVIKPELAGQLTYIIQGLVVLFIGADILILYVWNSRRKLRRNRAAAETAKT